MWFCFATACSCFSVLISCMLRLKSLLVWLSTPYPFVLPPLEVQGRVTCPWIKITASKSGRGHSIYVVTSKPYSSFLSVSPGLAPPKEAFTLSPSTDNMEGSRGGNTQPLGFWPSLLILASQTCPQRWYILTDFQHHWVDFAVFYFLRDVIKLTAKCPGAMWRKEDLTPLNFPLHIYPAKNDKWAFSDHHTCLQSPQRLLVMFYITCLGS